MYKTALTIVAVLAIVAFAAPAEATVIGFESAEGYSTGMDLHGQPTSGTTWYRYKGSDSGDFRVTSGVGVGGTNGLDVYLHGTAVYDAERYAFQTGTPEVGTFDPNSSVITYEYKFMFTGPGSNADNRRVYVQVGRPLTYGGQVDAIQFRNSYGGAGYIYYAPQNPANPWVAGNGGWNTVKIVADWGTKTYQIWINGVDLTNPTYTHFRDTTALPDLSVASYLNGASSAGAAGVLDDINITPEPATMTLLAMGGGLALLRKRR